MSDLEWRGCTVLSVPDFGVWSRNFLNPKTNTKLAYPSPFRREVGSCLVATELRRGDVRPGGKVCRESGAEACPNPTKALRWAGIGLPTNPPHIPYSCPKRLNSLCSPSMKPASLTSLEVCFFSHSPSPSGLRVNMHHTQDGDQ